MPFEFRCSQCGKLLRTGDDTAGRQAQCPECGALTQVPLAPEPVQAAPSSSYTTARSENPYQAPDTYAVARPLDRLSTPATGLIVLSILGIAGQAICILANLGSIMVGANRFGRVQDVPELVIEPIVSVGFGGLGLVLSVLVLVGALHMKRLESYSLAMTAAIVSVIPCLAPCCVFSLPFGIWALVVLSDPQVKAAFQR